MDPAALALLCCPACRAALTESAGSLRCPSGHAYDLARQGYVSLLTGAARQDTADSAAMVEARSTFLAAGHYDPLSSAVAALAARGPVVDVGAGTGHHTARVLAAHGTVGVALDSSKPAARRAARAHPRLASVLADAWGQLPVRDGVAGSVLSIFAPRGPAEAARMLAPGGRYVVATPTPRHLAELVEELGLVTVDPRKPERLAAQLAGWQLAEQTLVEKALSLTEAEVRAVVAMGPSARHGSAPVRGPAETTLSVLVAAYVPA
ncbi:MAG: methyltransferase type 11 [Frankiales bacterium]|nr:methyltransferase type 11 [Frankiales bacterium]